jgi:hypothetical protein
MGPGGKALGEVSERGEFALVKGSHLKEEIINTPASAWDIPERPPKIDLEK